MQQQGLKARVRAGFCALGEDGRLDATGPPLARSATIIADEPSRLLVLSRRDFQALIETHPRAALRVLTELSRRLRRADARRGYVVMSGKRLLLLRRIFLAEQDDGA